MLKNYFKNKKVVIFDMDGTTLQTEEAWTKALTKIMELEKIPLFYDPGPSGSSLRDRWKIVLERSEKEADEKKINYYMENTIAEFLKHVDEITLTEGFWNFAAELKLKRKMKLALVTNTNQELTNKLLKKFEIDKVFDFILCGDQVSKHKPHPEIYLATLKHFGVKAKDAVVFEDSIIGSTSAGQAGIDTFIIWDGMPPVEKYPKTVIDFSPDFTKLPQYLDSTYLEEINNEVELIKESRKEP